MKAILAILILISGFGLEQSAFAASSSNNGLVYHGRIVKPDGTMLNSGGAQFTLQIYGSSDRYWNGAAPAIGSDRCLLYQEIHTVNMTNSLGAFELKVGEGSSQQWGVGAVAADRLLSRLFVNYPYNALTNTVTANKIKAISCSNSSASGNVYYPYNDSSTYHEWVDRELVVSVNLGTTSFSLPSMAIRSTPFAMQAAQVAGYSPYNLFKIDGSSANVFTPAQHDFLWNLSQIKDVSGVSCANGEILKVVGGQWKCAVDDGGAGVVTAVTATAPLSVSGAATSDVRINNGSTAGDTLRWTGSAWGITRLGISDISGIVQISQGGTGTTTAPSNGQVLIGGTSGYVPANLTAGAGINISNASGSISISTNNLNPGSISSSGNANQVAIYSSGGVLTGENQLAPSRGGTGVNPTPTSGGLLIGTGDGHYNFTTLTQGSGISITNVSGGITIATTNAGTVTAVNGVAAANPLLGVGANGTQPNWTSNASTNVLNLPMASSGSVTAGLISNTEYAALLPKALSSGAIFIGNGSSQATAQYLSQDVLVGATGVATVSGIGGYPISGTLSGATPKSLIYANSKINATSIPTCATNYYLTFNGTDYSCVLDAGASGAISSIALSLPSFISVTSPAITSGSGTLTGTLINQNANTVFAGPSSGGAAAPTFRALVPADISGGAIGSILRSNGSNVPEWSTTTYPDTVAGSSLLYASSNNVVAPLLTPAAGGGVILAAPAPTYVPTWISGASNTFLRGDGTFAAVPSSVSGSGTANRVAMFTPIGTMIGDSPIAVSGGNVGVGTTSPDALLDVGGQAILRNELSTANYVKWAGIHTDGRMGLSTQSGQKIFGVRDGSGMAIGNTNTGVGPGGLTGNINIFAGVLAPAFTGAFIGTGHIGAGTHKSLIIATPETSVNGYGAAGIVDLGTLSYSGNAPSGVRPTMRYTANNHQFRVDSGHGGANGGTDAMMIDSSGNVGIGLTSPSARLNIISGSTVAGTAPIKITSGALMSSAEAGAIEYDGNNLYYTDGTNTRRALATATAVSGAFVAKTGDTMTGILNLPSNGLVAGTNQLVISGGNVGIGTTSPSTLLEIAAFAPELSIRNNVNGTQAPTLNFKSDFAGLANVNKVMASLQGAPDTSTGGRLILNTTDTSGTIQERMRIDASGNVGIGTTSPTANLEVSGSPSSTLKISSANSTTLRFAPTFGAGNAILDSVNGTGFDFRTDGVNRMFIQPSGNVGIGLTAPTARLNIVSGSTVAGTAPIKITSGALMSTPEAGAIEYDGNNLYYTDGGATRKTLATSVAGGYVAKSGDTMTGTLNLPANGLVAGTNQLVISGGNVGIGTTSPANKLAVVDGTAAGAGVGQIAVKTTDGLAAYVGIQGNSWNALGLWGPGGSFTGNPTIGVSTSGITISGPISEYSGSIRFTPRGDIGTSPGVLFTSGGAAIKTFAVKAAASQTANLTEWQNSSGTAMSVVDASGNVGIGTTSPTAPLNVSGASKFENGNLRVVAGQASVAPQTSSVATPLAFDTNLGNMMTWTTNDATPTININNMQAGASYILIVRGTGTGAPTINCWTGVGTGGLTTSALPTLGTRSGQATIYNILTNGTHCYITWASGFP